MSEKNIFSIISSGAFLRTDASTSIDDLVKEIEFDLSNHFDSFEVDYKWDGQYYKVFISCAEDRHNYYSSYQFGVTK
jgi:hypothetical protein